MDRSSRSCTAVSPNSTVASSPSLYVCPVASLHLDPFSLKRSFVLPAFVLQLVLYQGSQVVAGQVTVAILKAWARRVKAKNERLLLDETTPGSLAEDKKEDGAHQVGDGAGEGERQDALVGEAGSHESVGEKKAAV